MFVYLKIAVLYSLSYMFFRSLWISIYIDNYITRQMNLNVCKLVADEYLTKYYHKKTKTQIKVLPEPNFPFPRVLNQVRYIFP